MTSNEKIFQDYFNWTFSLLLATDPHDPTTREIDISYTQNHTKPIEVYTVTSRWDTNQIALFNAMLGNKTITFNTICQGKEPSFCNCTGTLTVVEGMIPQQFLSITSTQRGLTHQTSLGATNIGTASIVRGLSITPTTVPEKTTQPPFNLYMVKQEKKYKDPLFISDKPPYKLYSITARIEDQDKIWKAIQKITTISGIPFTPFNYFLNNSAKYINQCCNLNSLHDQTTINFKKSCTDEEFIFDPFSQLPNPKCDSTMTTLCATGPNYNNEVCACINRSNTDLIGNIKLYNYLTKQLNIPETCISGVCNEQVSYVPANLRRQICPNICSSILNADAKGYANIEIDGIKMTVECNKKSGEISITDTLESVKNSNKQQDRWVLYVQIIIILVLIFLLFFL